MMTDCPLLVSDVVSIEFGVATDPCEGQSDRQLQCEISEVGVPFYLLLAYLKATNLHTSKKVEEKHARLAKFKSCLHHCHLQCTVDVHEVISIQYSLR